MIKLNILCAFVIILFGAFCISGCAQTTIPDDLTKASDGATIVNASEGNSTKTRNSDTGEEKASCETKFNEKSVGRAHNIKLAASKLNGAVINPGETFSYNDTIGPTGKSSGYKKARIFVLGKDAEGYGGGVCQVSSALYNCALDLGLEIVERHPHSKPVGYVPKGKDAATSYGGKDLKFTNTLNIPLTVTAEAANGILTVRFVS